MISKTDCESLIKDNQVATLSPSTCTFQVRHDQVSTQVSCEQDHKFWFRLEVANSRDSITDFSLGAFDSGIGGDLLALCYKKADKTPQRSIVFCDFLSSGPSDPAAITTAKTRFEEYAKVMLATYGRSVHAAHIERQLGPRREKLDLVIDT
jgi:hypothetical protein